MPSFPTMGRKPLRASVRTMSIETLERRELFSISPNSQEAPDGALSHGGGCSCPICAGTIANSPELWAPLNAASSAKQSLSALPQLNSLAGAQYTLFLDFNGSVTSGWSSQSVVTPVYDFDGDKSTFSTAELNAIFEIWARVAEDYAPFNINVTTVDPGHLTEGQVAKVAIGGNYTDWFGQSAGGVAYVGGFYNSASNVGFVFSDALAGGVPRYVAEAATHEAGHLFGLWHQSSYNASGNKTAEYSSGNGQWAPIMGVGYYAQVTTWHVGANNLGPNVIQDDMAVLSGRLGYRADEAGNFANAAAQLQVSGNAVGGTGVISYHTDQDYYRFSTGGGSVTLSANTAAIGANLDLALELRRADGSLVSSASPTNSLSASLSANLAAGDYFLVVRSAGQYGFVGNYTLSGIVPAALNNNTGNNGAENNTSNDNSNSGGNETPNNPVGDGGQQNNNQNNNPTNNPNNNPSNNNNPQTTGPNIRITVDGQSITEREIVLYGTVIKGTRAQKTFVIHNDGDSPLILNQLTKRGVPRGFTLVQGFSKTVLAAGESATFVLQMSHKRGNYGGWLAVTSNDADQRNFQFAVAGVVNRSGIEGGRSEVVSDANAALATGISFAGLGLESDIAAPHVNSGMASVAVERAFDEVGRSQTVAPRQAATRFDLPATRWHEDHDWQESDELVDRLEDQFSALDEAISGVLMELV